MNFHLFDFQKCLPDVEMHPSYKYFYLCCYEFLLALIKLELFQDIDNGWC